ncbi:MAG: CocE/NonD family hydrolase [Gemmatimonadales bacterium]
MTARAVRRLAGLALAILGQASVALGQRPNLPLDLPKPIHEFAVTRNVMVPMRDGIKLATNLYLPRGAGERLPVILMRTPYNKETYVGATRPAEFFAGQGYAVVTQDVRGQFASEGEYRVQQTDDVDGYDTIDWIVQQPWSTGKVGTYGCSYLGEVQYLVSKRRHPALIAMIPQSASGAVGSAGGYYTNFGTYEGGALTLSTIFGWFGVAGMKDREAPDYRIGSRQYPFDFAEMLETLPLNTLARRAGYPRSDYEDFVSHPPADPYWAEVPYLTDADRFDTPAIHVNSWFDVTPEQTLYVWNLMQKNAVSERGRDHQYVIMSPTTHCASEAATGHTMVGNRDVGDARFPYWSIYLAWFDHWLRGRDNRITALPKVHYYVIGKNEWRTADQWPVPEMEPTPFYLSAGPRGAQTVDGDGTLGTAKTIATQGDTFVYDPADPFPSRGGTICCTGNPKDQPGIFEQTDLESRSDLLVYTTPVLDRGVTIAGTVKAVLYVSSSAKDTDFTAKLIDVDPDGRSWNVLNGIKRARYREGFDRTVWMEKDGVYRVEVSLKATAYHFAPGHRIRLWVSSSDFPGYDRNLNTGGHNYDETSWLKATNTVHHGGRYPSHLLLPVLPK